MIRLRTVLDKRLVTTLVKAETKTSSQAVRADVVAALIDATPRDTGAAASRWTATPVDSNGLFFVSNDSSYIGRLNAGWSNQAPSRFIETVALKFGNPFGAVVTYLRRK